MFILASKSPRRKLLMQEIVPAFSIEEAKIDEEKYRKDTPIETVKNIALHKALAVFKNHPEDIVISADTIVVLNNKIYGKPKSEKEAHDILRSLSGKSHNVITAYCIACKKDIITNYVTTKVTFNTLSDDLIYRYIKSGSPMDKAGAYGIQDNDKFHIIKNIEGSYQNVVGFPVFEIKDILSKIDDSDKR